METALCAIECLILDDAAMVELRNRQAGRAVAIAMASHVSIPKIQRIGCKLLYRLSLDTTKKKVHTVTQEEIMAILNAMAGHP